MRSNVGVLRVALAFVALLGSLTFVVWRQARAYELLREFDALRSARAIEEAERSDLGRRIVHLESRARVVAAAETRLGMKVPNMAELVMFRLGGPDEHDPVSSSQQMATAAGTERSTGGASGGAP